MEYIISFLEGFICFISPCLLPMLPIYISYFSGQKAYEKKSKTLINSIGFVLGFTLIFILLGVFASTFGKFIHQYSKIINIIFGIIIILFGLNFMQVIKIPILNKTKKFNSKVHDMNFFTSMLFGIIFSVGWTPCVGAFLGTALMAVASGAEIGKGIMMLLLFSLGLGIPFILSAMLINKLKVTFDIIKKNYKIINIISGSFLILIGILMMTGLLGRFLTIFN
jgi:cytochrome c biogenesis protein transmembrane region